MAVHFNWTQLIDGVHHGNTHVATAAVVSVFLIALCVVGRFSLGSGEAAIVPAGRLSFKGFFEAIIELIASMAEMVMGKNGSAYVPLFACIFLFVLTNNLVGLLPGMTPATDNFNTTLALGIFVFITYNLIGIFKKKAGYIGDYTGHLPFKLGTFWLIPIMFPIELLSHCFRPMSLGLRLAGNMTGDHSVLGVFISILPSPFVYFVPIVFYALGLLVCCIQAVVFTLLSMAYVMMAQDVEDH